MVSNESSSPSTRRMQIAGHQTLEKSHLAQKPSPTRLSSFSTVKSCMGIALPCVNILCAHLRGWAHRPSWLIRTEITLDQFRIMRLS